MGENTEEKSLFNLSEFSLFRIKTDEDLNFPLKFV